VLWRPFEGCPAGRQNASFTECLARARTYSGVELIPGGPVEGAAGIRADLRLHAELTEERERPARGMSAREVEMNGELAVPAQVPDPCCVEEGGELGQAAAASLRSDRCELVPQVLRE
jgi:hypothetical protein